MAQQRKQGETYWIFARKLEDGQKSYIRAFRCRVSEISIAGPVLWMVSESSIKGDPVTDDPAALELSLAGNYPIPVDSHDISDLKQELVSLKRFDSDVVLDHAKAF